MNDRDRKELHDLEQELHRLEVEHGAGLVSERAYVLRRDLIQGRQRQLRQGVPWAQEQRGSSVIK